ncbi:ankyrin repeat-containing domain protein, partial [Jimgerdemannia flammicorona]
ARRYCKLKFERAAANAIGQGKQVMTNIWGHPHHTTDILYRQADRFVWGDGRMGDDTMRLMENVLMLDKDSVSMTTIDVFFRYPTGEYMNIMNTLWDAIRGRYKKCILYILNTSKLDVDTLGKLTPTAIASGRIDSVNLLLEFGVQFHPHDLACAAKNANIDILKLVGRECKLTQSELDSVLCAVLENRNIPAPNIEHLLDLGASANAVRDGYSALYEACDADAIRVLCERGANTMERYDDGTTKFHRLRNIYDEYFELTVPILLKYGADINAVDDHGRTPLFTALNSDRILIRSLCKYGADIDAVDNNGFTVLHHAAKTVHFSDIIELRMQGANIYFRENLTGKTPLLMPDNYLPWAIAEFCLSSSLKPHIYDIPDVKSLTTTLPAEIWSQVLYYYYHDNTFKKFLEMSEVCKQWHALVKNRQNQFDRFIVYNDCRTDLNKAANVLRGDGSGNDTLIIIVDDLIDCDHNDIEKDVKNLIEIVQLSQPRRLGIIYNYCICEDDDNEEHWNGYHEKEDLILAQILKFTTNVEELLTNGYDSKTVKTYLQNNDLTKITLVYNYKCVNEPHLLGKCVNIRSANIYGIGNDTVVNSNYHEVLSAWPELREVGLFGHGGHLSRYLRQLNKNGSTRLKCIQIADIPTDDSNQALKELLKSCPELVQLHIDTPRCEIALIDDDTIRILLGHCPKLQTLVIPPHPDVCISILSSTVNVIVQ